MPWSIDLNNIDNLQIIYTYVVREDWTQHRVVSFVATLDTGDTIYERN